MFGAANHQIRDPQRLSVDSAVDGTRKEFAKGGGLDVGSRQREFVGIGSVAQEIVVVGGDASEIGYADSGGSAFWRIGKTGRCDGDTAGSVCSHGCWPGFFLAAQGPPGD